MNIQRYTDIHEEMVEDDANGEFVQYSDHVKEVKYLTKLVKLIYYQRIDSMGDKVQDYLERHNRDLDLEILALIHED